MLCPGWLPGLVFRRLNCEVQRVLLSSDCGGIELSTYPLYNPHIILRTSHQWTMRNGYSAVPQTGVSVSSSYLRRLLATSAHQTPPHPPTHPHPVDPSGFRTSAESLKCELGWSRTSKSVCRSRGLPLNKWSKIRKDFSSWKGSSMKFEID